MNKNSKIGIFDSGIGGVTVLREILKVLPNEEFIYYSDSKNNPYGDKDKEEVINISDKIVQALFEKDCKAIVIACNTASAMSADRLREKYPDKIFIAIEPAYKVVYDQNPQDVTLVMATKGTIESEKFNILYNKYNNNKTYLLPCVGLADIIENGNKDEVEEYLKENLKEYKNEVKNVVLGCTHYPLIKDEISKQLGKVKFFDGSYRLAIHLKEVLKGQGLLREMKANKDNVEFIDSSNSKIKEERFYKILKEG